MTAPEKPTRPYSSVFPRQFACTHSDELCEVTRSSNAEGRLLYPPQRRFDYGFRLRHTAAATDWSTAQLIKINCSKHARMGTLSKEDAAEAAETALSLIANTSMAFNQAGKKSHFRNERRTGGNGNRGRSLPRLCSGAVWKNIRLKCETESG